MSSCSTAVFKDIEDHTVTSCPTLHLGNTCVSKLPWDYSY